ncbi:MFS transporter [Arenivirga flava]|nr:MFS transporter [Arenivirga flava]
MRTKLPVITYLTSSTLSALGNAIAAVALPLLLLTATGSALGAGVLAVATAVPSVLAGVLGGALIDRMDRRVASAIADAVSALALLALPIVDTLAGLELGWFVLFGILGAVGDVPGTAAREALSPQIARAAGMPLERLIGLREAGQAIAIVVGPGLAAVLVTGLSSSGVLIATAVTSTLAAIATLLLPRSVGRPSATSAAVARGDGPAGVLAGLRLVLRRGPVRAVMLLGTGVIAVVGTMQGLLLPVHLHATGQQPVLGLALSALALGSLLGAGLTATVSGRLRRRVIVVVALLASVLPVIGLALLPPAGVLIGAAVLLGFVSAPLGAVLGAALLDSVDDRLHGRVLGAQNAFALVAAPLTIGATSVVVEVAGTRAAGIALASLWALVVLAALLSRSVRRVTAAPTVEPTAGAASDAADEHRDDDAGEGSADAQR